MNAPQPSVPKKYFVITDSGETGPFAPAVLNRMFSRGEIKGTQMCRLEDASEVHRLDEVFRHMSPSQTVVEAARKNVAAYNIKSGSGNMKVGAIMFFGSLWYVFTTRFINVYAIAFMIVGVSLTFAGLTQRRRGKTSQAKFSPKSPNESIPPANSPTSSKYDY